MGSTPSPPAFASEACNLFLRPPAELRDDFPTPDIQARRLDAFRLYLGLPQVAGTFKISEFSPSRARDRSAEYFAFSDAALELEIKDYALWFFRQDGGSVEPGRTRIIRGASQGILGAYRVSVGVDEIGRYVSYYDRWDLNPFSGLFSELEASEIAGAGRPLEVYGRVYLSPDE
ncbi:MAG: hypothetical protein H6729_10475 [Deltaproteobacteria bacterium]|nr:hypothetical protein [Deltaproteobacteria bacterium]